MRLAGKQRRKFSSLETLIDRIKNRTVREGGKTVMRGI